VGGPEQDPRSRKVEIRHSSAIVKGIAEGTIEWERDPDFGYRVAAHVPGLDPSELGILQPRTLYASSGRGNVYERDVARLRAERTAFLAGFPALDPALLDAVR
jgi:phosphoenolpyruvate carboxykinase (ATP)